MLQLLFTLLATAKSSLKPQRDLALENLALRQQLAILKRSNKRPRLTRADRAFWVALSRVFADWRQALIIVKPETVIAWHRKGFKLFWRWKSRSRGGRPTTGREVRDLIRKMANENPTWGAPRIHGELLALGFDISEPTVSRYMPKRDKPPSQGWRTFLLNHVGDLASVDFFVVPTATFRLLYVFVVLAHDRRRIVHFNVTDHPYARWAAQQIINAFPFDSAPRFLIRDNDGIFGREFVERVDAMGIKQVKIAPRSPWQNPYCERLIGSIRRECLNHVIILGERHLMRVLREYVAYYHSARTHLSLHKDAPDRRPVAANDNANIVAIPMVGGLHHKYVRQAA